MAVLYKIVYLIPSHLHESRFAIGAVVRKGSTTQFVRAPRLPSADALGGHDAHWLLQAVLERAPTLATFEDREAKRLLGQHVAFGSERSLTLDLPDPAAWIQHAILPQPLPAGSKRPAVAHRADLGHRVLTELQLGPYLQPHKFQPHSAWPAARDKMPHVKPVRDWVSAKQGGVLLMEPALVGHGPAGMNVCARLMAYARLFELLGPAVGHSKIVSFVVPSGSTDDRRALVRELRKTQTPVFDVADDSEAAQLGELVRETHREGLLV